MIGDNQSVIYFKPRRGFTFMEMIVVVLLFSLVMMATADLFIRSQRTQRKTAALQRLQDDVRFLINKMALELQLGSLDYGAYANAQQCGAAQSSINPLDGNDTLVVRRFDGSRLFIKKADDICVDAQSAPCFAVSEDGTSWSAASGRGVKVETMKFFITPAKDPLVYCESEAAYVSDQQPRVTITLTVSATVTSVREPVELAVQTTISSRNYQR